MSVDPQRTLFESFNNAFNQISVMEPNSGRLLSNPEISVTKSKTFGTRFCHSTSWFIRTFDENYGNSTVQTRSKGMLQFPSMCWGICMARPGRISSTSSSHIPARVSSTSPQTWSNRAIRPPLCFNWPRSSSCQSTCRQCHTNSGSTRCWSNQSSGQSCVNHLRGTFAIDRIFGKNFSRFLSMPRN